MKSKIVRHEENDMTNKPEHTALPWEMDKKGRATIGFHGHTIFPIVSKCETGVAVCILPDEDETKATLKEVKNNAAFIVRACNSHYELVEAIKDRAIKSAIDNGVDESKWELFLTKMESEALAKAKGE